jgi:hypothetical protein
MCLRRDLRSRIFFRHPKCERAPAAAKLENFLAIGQLGTLPVQRQHGVLCLLQRFIAARVIAARVLQALAQALLEERGRQLVVLCVRRIGVNRHRALTQHVDALGVAGSLRIESTGQLLAQPLRAHAADALAQQRIGKMAAFGQAQQSGGRLFLRQFGGGGLTHRSVLLGNQGNSMGVVR